MSFDRFRPPSDEPEQSHLYSVTSRCVSGLRTGATGFRVLRLRRGIGL